jgi:hypothetical protein
MDIDDPLDPDPCAPHMHPFKDGIRRQNENQDRVVEPEYILALNQK